MKRKTTQGTALSLRLFYTVWLVTGCLAHLPAPAQTAVQSWMQRYNAPGSSTDFAWQVVTDAAGNAIVAGYSADAINRAGMLVIKYSGAGMPLWTNRQDGVAIQFFALAADGAGNVFVTGSSVSEAPSRNNYDYLTVAFSSDGRLLWTNRYDGLECSDDHPRALAVDANGNVFVTGSSGPDVDYLTIAYSGAGVPLWTNRYNGPAGNVDEAASVAVDGSGNVFVTGTSYSESSADFATIKYSSAGLPLWTNRYDGPAGDFDQAICLLVDGSGDVLVSGVSQNGISLDYATVKYSAAGVPQWTNRYDGDSGSDFVACMALDGSGNVFVTGSSIGNGNFPGYATIKYSAAGVSLWTNRFTSPGNMRATPTALATDNGGNVFVTGVAYSESAADYATIKYSGSGLPLWTNRYDGPGKNTDWASAIAVDNSGNAFVTGISWGDTGSYDYCTIKYSGRGIPLWTNRYDGPANSGGVVAAVAVDSTGTTFVTGSARPTSSVIDYATIAYSIAGAPLWTNLYNGPDSGVDVASAVAVDNRGKVFVTGWSWDRVTSNDYATLAYSTAGLPLWTNRYDGPGNGDDRSSAMAVDGKGDIYVTGSSQSIDRGYDYATLKYSSTGIPLWTNRFNGLANSNDSATAIVIDTSGNVFVTGSSYSGADNAYDYVTIAYSGRGTPLWTNLYNGGTNSTDTPSALAVDSSGNVIVTGSSEADYLTIKYSGAGVALWTNRYDGVLGLYDFANAVAVDRNGDVIVTGLSFTVRECRPMNFPFVSDYATIKYSSTGVPLWTNLYHAPGCGNGVATAVEVDRTGTIFVTGYAESSLDPGSADFATIAYSAAGAPLWTNCYNGPANGPDQPLGNKCLAIAPDGVVVVGNSDGDFSTGSVTTDYATVKYRFLISARTNLQDVLSEMIEARGGLTIPVQDRLDNAIAYISASLNPLLWVDNNHLEPKPGQEVFQNTKAAINQLNLLVSDQSGEIISGSIWHWTGRVVQAARSLADTGVDQAAALSDDPNKIARAREEIAEGDATEREANALENYRNAWESGIRIQAHSEK